MNEQSLVRSAATGDARAFEELIIPYEKPIYNFCLRMLNDAGEAEDASQEVFIKVYKNIGRYRERHAGSFKSWVYAIANNACVDELRKRKARARPESLDTVYETEGGEMSAQFASTEQTPEQAVIVNERQKILSDAISGLPTEFRRMIILRDLRGLSYEEISGVTGAKLGTVKSKISRARAALRERVEKKYAGTLRGEQIGI